MSVYIFGDTHAVIDTAKLSARQFPESKRLTENDYVIICGDFGFPFLPSDILPESEKDPNCDIRSSRRTYRYWMDWFASKPFNILFVDGNHECFEYWYNQPSEEWHGGLIHRSTDAPNVIHLQRGEYYEIDGHTFWCFGGAESHDKMFRIPGFDWSPAELPSMPECLHGFSTLGKHDGKVDYIITHTAPKSILYEMGFDSSYFDPVSKYLDVILKNTKYKFWFCGHMHQDILIPQYRLNILYNDHFLIERGVSQ